MPKVNVKDILEFLDGSSTPSTIKTLQSWATSDVENAKDLELYQKIYNELPHLHDHKRTDISLAEVLDKNIPVVKTLEVSDTKDVTEHDLLLYLEGRLDYSNKKRVEDWSNQSGENKKDLELLNRISSESKFLSEYKEINQSLEWNQFKSKEQSKGIAKNSLDNQVLYKENTAPQENNERRLIPLWTRYVAAAAILLLACLLVFKTNLMGSRSERASLVTVETPKDIVIPDGTKIILGEYSELTYFTNAEKVNVRSVELDGEGDFEVKPYQGKEFEVITTDQIGVTVLGTRFTVNDSKDFIKVVKNIEGTVKVYALHDTSVNVIVHAGESYGYDGVKFIKIESLPEVDKNAKDYDALYVLDYLMRESNWKVISSPYTEFEGDDIIRINLDQPYEQILEDLVSRADFSYEKLACDGCYRISRLQAE